VTYRGTPEQPGLVLGLNRGGACRGIGFLIAAAKVGEVLGQLWAREMSHLVYQPSCCRSRSTRGVWTR
jgi:cation transport protein ChaC